MNEVKEIWKNIPEYDGIYQISNFGRIKSLERIIYDSRGWECRIRERILKNRIGYRKYWMINLNNEGKCKTYQVYRLVANAFIQNIDNKPCVNHIDGNKLNCHVSNLEFVTHLENYKHAVSAGLTKEGTGGGYRKEKKRIVQFDLHNNFIKEWDAISWAAKELRINRSNIQRCLSNKIQTAYGFKWQYVK